MNLWDPLTYIYPFEAYSCPRDAKHQLCLGRRYRYSWLCGLRCQRSSRSPILFCVRMWWRNSPRRYHNSWPGIWIKVRYFSMLVHNVLKMVSYAFFIIYVLFFSKKLGLKNSWNEHPVTNHSHFSYPLLTLETEHQHKKHIKEILINRLPLLLLNQEHHYCHQIGNFTKKMIDNIW